MARVADHPPSQAFGVFGVSGVGKTSLIAQAVRQNGSYLHVQASELIKKGLLNPALSSELLRKLDRDSILDNQSILVSMFQNVRLANPDKVVVLDAHSVIDTRDQLVRIPVAIIRDLQLSGLIFISDLPDHIVSRREQDRSRTRPKRTTTEIADLQDMSLKLCYDYASNLGLPLKVVSATDEWGLSLALAQRPSTAAI